MFSLRKMIGLVLVLVSFGALAMSCAPKYVPAQNGTCGPGRTWVAPQADANGDMQSGYCTWQNQ